MLRSVPVGSGKTHTKVRIVGARAPNLRTIDNPAVALATRPRADARQIGTGRRLGVELAPDLFTGQDLRHVLSKKIWRCVSEHRTGDRAEGDRASRAEIRHDISRGLLAEDALVGRAKTCAAVFLWEGDARVAGVEQLVLQRPAFRNL